MAQKHDLNVALGAKKGIEKLTEELDKGLDSDAWVKRALMSVVIGSAPASISSARSALRWWASFADEMSNALYGPQ